MIDQLILPKGEENVRLPVFWIFVWTSTGKWFAKVIESSCPCSNMFKFGDDFKANLRPSFNKMTSAFSFEIKHNQIYTLRKWVEDESEKNFHSLFSHEIVYLKYIFSAETRLTYSVSIKLYWWKSILIAKKNAHLDKIQLFVLRKPTLIQDNIGPKYMRFKSILFHRRGKASTVHHNRCFIVNRSTFPQNSNIFFEIS